ncbi:hypothetical protein Patl1_12963 [Pistacia atlantica]|uniref:Uncharacterized protein n=1 Tax=Pistacia atlantica TaxID=434234 RepID=A0ACC1AUF1_9ROSI|nr:hypothetical protein Patl1_12963 [Pistacia atlantica]
MHLEPLSNDGARSEYLPKPVIRHIEFGDNGIKFGKCSIL